MNKYNYLIAKFVELCVVAIAMILTFIIFLALSTIIDKLMFGEITTHQFYFDMAFAGYGTGLFSAWIYKSIKFT